MTSIEGLKIIRMRDARAEPFVELSVPMSALTGASLPRTCGVAISLEILANAGIETAP